MRRLVIILLFVACVPGRTPEVAQAERGPCPFPTAPGLTIDEVKRRVATHFKADEAMDVQDEWAGQGPAWRSRTYMVEIPGEAVNVQYRYRQQDGRVWAVSIGYARGRYSGRIGEIDLGANVAHIEKTLGPPSKSHAIAPVVDQHVWVRGDATYVVDAYSEEYGSNRPGDVTSVLLYSRELGPRGFTGYEADEIPPPR